MDLHFSQSKSKILKMALQELCHVPVAMPIPITSNTPSLTAVQPYGTQVISQQVSHTPALESLILLFPLPETPLPSHIWLTPLPGLCSEVTLLMRPTLNTSLLEIVNTSLANFLYSAWLSPFLQYLSPNIIHTMICLLPTRLLDESQVPRIVSGRQNAL